MNIPNYCETCVGGEFHMAMRPITQYFNLDIHEEIDWLNRHGIEDIKNIEYISHGNLVKDFCIPMKWAIAWIPNIGRHTHVNADEVIKIHEHIFVNMKFFGLC